MFKPTVSISNLLQTGNDSTDFVTSTEINFYEADPSGRAVCGRTLAGIAGSNPAGSMDARYSMSVPRVSEKR
jgi:hypothetical protein